MKLDWKTADENDGWSEKPYEIARRGKLLFRLMPRTRRTSHALIGIAHDEIVERPYTNPTCNSTPTFIFERMTSTAAARDYAESFDYAAWRSSEIEKAKADRETAKETLAETRKRVRETKQLPTDA